MLADTLGGTPSSWAGSIALVVAALAAAYATVYAARRGVPAGRPAPPPPPADDDDADSLLARLWFEMLSRGDAMAAELETLRHENLDLRTRLDVANAERLDLLRRLARGDAP